VCRRLTGDDADAADACQEALLAVVRGLPRFDARSSFSTWAYRVATNAALDELRRRRRRPEPGLPREWGAEAWEAAEVGGAEGRAVDDRVAERLDVDAALQHLSPEFRAAVVLRDLAGLSYEEIAEALALPIGTVRSRIARGRSAVGELLAPGGNPPTAADRRRGRR
jgi:RNA polymerase sigma-70 factor (ECF subfamily)